MYINARGVLYALVWFFTWKTNKTASMKAAIAERIPPITQFDCGNVTFPLSLVEVNEVNATGGPSYIVIVSAPVMDTRVPIDLARLLRTLKSRFSILVTIHIIWDPVRTWEHSGKKLHYLIFSTKFPLGFEDDMKSQTDSDFIFQVQIVWI